MADGLILAVCQSSTHDMAKEQRPEIELREGLGVLGDAHQGVTVQHRSRVAKDPSQPNLRQVHLIHAELHEALRAQGFSVEHGAMGENIVTRNIDLLGLPTGAVLRLGASALVQITGLRNPCAQLDGVQKGLMAATLGRDAEGGLIRKAGVMGVVLAGGRVAVGDKIELTLPPEPHQRLAPV